MANIFIHGLNSKTGGGKSILNNYLSILKDTSSEHNYFVLTPKKVEYKKYSNNFINIIDINDIYKKNILFIITNSFLLPSILEKLQINVIFNFSDIPIPAKNIKQVFLFDWPYAVYPESEAWNMMDIKSFIMRKIKLYFFKKYLKYVTTMIAQTDTIKSRLERLYHIKDIEVVPNAISLENMDGGKYKDFKLPSGIKLLYLTYYYPHKNLEIFIPLAQEIKKRNLDFKIIITISESQHQNVKSFLDEIKELELDKIILNLGPIDMKNVASLYKQSDGLLMPTLLETYGLPYIEAMHHEKIVLTSNLDFAQDVCKDAGTYFNPLDSTEILDTLIHVFNNKNLIDKKINRGTKLLDNLNSWNSVLSKYNKIMEINNDCKDK